MKKYSITKVVQNYTDAWMVMTHEENGSTAPSYFTTEKQAKQFIKRRELLDKLGGEKV